MDCVVVTTQKDLVKLRLPQLARKELWALRVRLSSSRDKTLWTANSRKYWSERTHFFQKRRADRGAVRPARSENLRSQVPSFEGVPRGPRPTRRRRGLRRRLARLAAAAARRDRSPRRPRPSLPGSRARPDRRRRPRRARHQDRLRALPDRLDPARLAQGGGPERRRGHPRLRAGGGRQDQRGRGRPAAHRPVRHGPRDGRRLRRRRACRRRKRPGLGAALGKHLEELRRILRRQQPRAGRPPRRHPLHHPRRPRHRHRPHAPARLRALPWARRR